MRDAVSIQWLLSIQVILFQESNWAIYGYAFLKPDAPTSLLYTYVAEYTSSMYT